MQRAKNLWLALLFGGLMSGVAAMPGQRQVSGCVPPVVAHLAPLGRLSPTNQLQLAISLPLRDPAGLNALLAQLYDPASTNFHRFLTPPELATRFGPTKQEYAALRQFAISNGFTVLHEFPNRLVLSVAGRVTDIERTFQITLHTYRHPTEPRNFFAPDTGPLVPASLNVLAIEGLSDFSLPRPAGLKANAVAARPLSFNGTGPGHEYMGKDFRNAYVPGTALDGSGQTVALLEYSDYFQVDITNYENAVGAQTGVTNYVPLNNVVVGTGKHPFPPGTANNSEVALDIEMAIAMAPKLSQVIVYEEKSADSAILSQIQGDNLAKQVSSSWMVGNWSSSTAATWDNILMLMAAQGQSYFQSSGDSDAYTGTETLDSGTTIPADSPYATVVGGTTLTMSGSGLAWGSETVWNYNNNGIPNQGSGGGVSTYYSIPNWQAGISMANNGGSTSMRNIPDVALTADNIYVCYNNGDTSGTYYFMGTSAAAPLWAGFTALVNQQAAQNGLSPVGFVNPTIYALATNANYASLFHDIATGNNIGTNAANLYYATSGYDLCTGLGSPNGTNLINALAPFAFPYVASQPASQTVTNGANVAFSASVSGATPLVYRWRLNGTNLVNGGNISGATTNTLTLASVSAASVGNYTLVVTNVYGAVTSSIASLTVLYPAAITGSSLTNRTGQCGENTNSFAITITGTAPVSVQWNLNGTPLSGATNTTFSLTNLGTSVNTVSVAVTNLYGGVTSNATLTVVDTLPPVIALNGANPLYVELGGTFTDPGAAAYDLCAGALPVNVSGTVNASVVGTNTLVYTANDGNGNSATNARTVIVRDTTPPTIVWSFTNLVLAVGTNAGTVMPDVTGTNYIIATDLSGAVAITQSPTNNAFLPLGTNAVLLAAADAYGNSSSSTNRIVVVVSTNAAPQIANPVVQGSGLVLPLSGAYGATYVLEAAADLTSGVWLPLATNTLGVDSSWEFTDPSVTNHPARFYRLKLVP
jgi:hypothetical protein